MKQIIFTATLIFAFCCTVFAQTTENQSKAAKISEYKEDYNSEKTKFAIFDLSEKLRDELSAEGVIKVQAKANKEIIRQIIKIKGYLKFLKVDLVRISLAISKDNEEIIQYWLVPFGAGVPNCEDCIIIRAEDYDKITDFFNPKPKFKKRKK